MTEEFIFHKGGVYSETEIPDWVLSQLLYIPTAERFDRCMVFAITKQAAKEEHRREAAECGKAKHRVEGDRMNNQQIADFIAEKVMGWTRVDRGNLKACYGTGEKGLESFVMHCDDWNSATNLDQAVQAAERIGDWSLALANKHYLAECGDSTHISTIGPADALSRAVVKAAGGTALLAEAGVKEANIDSD